jgi:glycine cleavage system H lipoate-binding protein/ABC-type phosphate transport system substrate-binding protein
MITEKTNVMKTQMLLFACLSILFFGTDFSKTMANTGDPASGTTITLSSTPGLYPLAKQWAQSYSDQHSAAGIHVVLLEASANPDAEHPTDLIMVEDFYFSGKADDPAWKMVVGHEAIVPVISASNPFLKELDLQGVTTGALTGLFTGAGTPEWGRLLNNTQSSPIHYYMINDPSVRSVFARLSGSDQLPAGVTLVENNEALISAVQKDPLALGFCTTRDIALSQDKALTGNLKLLPIDKNGNGKVDSFESIYDNFASFMRGVWVGKYPRVLCRNITVMAAAKPAGENEIAFLKWMITDGQGLLAEAGYTDLASGEKDAKLAMLLGTDTLEAVAGERYPYRTTVILLVIVVLSSALIGGIFWNRKQRRMAGSGTTHKPAEAFNEHSVEFPGGLFYDKSHTWTFMEKNGQVRIGIDDFLQHVTGPVTRIRMKNPGDKVVKGEKILSIIQDGKQLDIQAPISGTIRENNHRLLSNASLINASPYGDGWVYMIEPSNWLRETGFMIMAERYSEWLRNEFVRLRDFFAISESAHATGYAPMILQDGGELKAQALAGFGPEVWEDFQTRFIDATV